LLALTSCNGDEIPTGLRTPVASLSIEPDTVAVAIGKAAQLGVVARDAAGNELDDRVVSWASADPSVAVVDSSGQVTGVGEGTVAISAAVESKVAAAGVRVVLLSADEYEIVISDGDGQSGLSSAVLERPLVASVRRIDSHDVVVGVRVDWAVATGFAEVTRSSSVTDANGMADTRLMLGLLPGDVEVEASVAGLPPVTFQLQALPVPTVESIQPGSSQPGDTIQITVLGSVTGASIDVLFNGVAGETVGGAKGEPLVVRAIVPTPAGLCGPTTEIDVRLRVGGVTTAPFPLTVSVPADPFQVGQVLVIEGTQEAPCAVLPAAGGTARYMLGVLTAGFQQVGVYQVLFGADQVTVSPAASQPTQSTDDFHTRLRLYEQGLTPRLTPQRNAPTQVQFSTDPKVGSEREFWVFNTTSLSGQLTEEDFDRVTATLKFKGVHTLLYLDEREGLSDEEVLFLGRMYDRHLYKVNVDYFGEPSDQDNNDRVVVLLTPTVNSLSEPGVQSVIVGYTFALDLLPPDLPGCLDCRFSNGGEIFYGIVSDPTGVFTEPISAELALQLLPGVMVHELQHLISLRYRFLGGGPTNFEILWLSEALAQMAEELGGDEIARTGDRGVAEDLWLRNFDQAWRYMLNPTTHSLTAVAGGGTLGERGAGWLFLRWLADQYGDFIFRELTQSAERGVENIEARTGEPFFRLFADWAISLWADDVPLPGLSGRYQIPKWRLRLLLLAGDPPQYPLQPLQTTFADLRSQPIEAFMAASSPLFVEVAASGDTNALELQLQAATEAGIVILRIE
jgi:hypothetical protein